MLLALLACAPTPPLDSAADAPPFVDWSRQVEPLVGTSGQGRAWRRTIVHLHSPYSHDACDSHEGDLTDEQCSEDLRNGLCDDAIDLAFVTDHPAYAADQTYTDLLRMQGDDELVDGVANRITCATGHTLLWMPGIEDELMPVGLDRQAGSTADENSTLYNGSDSTSFDADLAAGALVWQAHTEERDLDTLRTRLGEGLGGMELFNLHAQVDPSIREDSLGLDPYGYLTEAGPFLLDDDTLQPDLVFLAIYAEQDVTITKIDTLAQEHFFAVTAGTDAHENSLPMAMTDGERVDSYRRMMRWFSNILLVDDDSPAAAQSALAAGHVFLAFEALGTPANFDVAYTVGGVTEEMGGSAATGGSLTVTCPTLADTSPQDGNTPEITVHVLRNGEEWQTGCGSWTLTDPGAYRVRVDLVPTHLTAFLSDQTALVHSYPWLYSSPLRVGLD